MTALTFTLCGLLGSSGSIPNGDTYENTVDQRFVRIAPGTFTMGGSRMPLPEDVAGKPFRTGGDYDEKPAHDVTITQPFYMATQEVTNAQYEAFDPSHKALRGKLGFSKADDEAVVFVSWHEAVRFCTWLAEKEGVPYRLPTEAEWVYACRAGTATPYHTGDSLPEAFHKNPKPCWYPDPTRSTPDDVVPLTVGQTPPNAWGLYDMHGNVEEWCMDWYGPYAEASQTDPVGRASGDFRVTRGGSHSTELYYLRSANRMAALPDEKSWCIGFRPVIGEPPKSDPLPVPPPAPIFQNVKQGVPDSLTDGPDPNKPYFKGPRTYVKIPEGSNGPLYSHHNHVPSLVECPNGDLLAIWYSCNQEPGREVSLVGSRLRYGENEWEPASLFWDAPDRTMASNAMWVDENGTLLHFIGLSAAATWGNLTSVLRTSNDNGATWSPARYIIPDHNIRHMPIESIFRAQDGTMVLPCDAVSVGQGGTALWMSKDNGETWYDAGGTIAGIHAGVVQLEDGRLLAFGRGDDVDGMMPMSVSDDMGATWQVSASVFPPISGGQRLVLERLQEGPLFFASYANHPMAITDASGAERTITGLYCAVSFDEGKTWPVRRVVSDDRPDHDIETMDGHMRPVGFDKGEPAGYLAVWQARNGLIHLIGSRAHHTFNLAWAKTLPGAEPAS